MKKKKKGKRKRKKENFFIRHQPLPDDRGPERQL
jgi:hypothetical protein